MSAVLGKQVIYCLRCGNEQPRAFFQPACPHCNSNAWTSEPPKLLEFSENDRKFLKRLRINPE